MANVLSLQKRLNSLEARNPINEFSHLNDEQLEEIIIELEAEVGEAEGLGRPITDDELYDLLEREGVILS